LTAVLTIITLGTYFTSEWSIAQSIVQNEYLKTDILGVIPFRHTLISNLKMNKRRHMDVMKLRMDYEVQFINEHTMSELWVTFHGPVDSLYEGGRWKVHVELPEQYPYKSPSIGFLTKMYHPNVDE
jgi:hypothetical protein